MSHIITMPEQRPHRSKQDYGTAPAFISAVEARFGALTFDLAATKRNAKAPRYYSSRDDSLSKPWHLLKGNLWLNPPFTNIGVWAKKCAEEGELGARIFFLTPASVATEWFANFIETNAIVLALRPRLTFVGQKDPYPKDLMLSCFGHGAHAFGTWRWDQQAVASRPRRVA